MQKKCVRNPDHIFVDRIDLQVEVIPVPFEDLAKAPQGENSATIKERVMRAREIQQERFKEEKGVYCNAQISAKLLQKYAILSDNCKDRLNEAMKRLDLSARAYERILKVSRTIADLEASENILPSHIAEAISYRNLDRSTWGE